MNSFIINNVRIVTAYAVLENVFLYVKRGIIEAIGPNTPGKVHKSCTIIDGHGSWLFPGIIDLYNNMLVNGSSFFTAENKLASHGVTTVCHFVPETKAAVVNEFNSFKKLGTIRHHMYNAPYLNEDFIFISASGIVQEAASQSNISISDIIENSGMHIICTDSESPKILDAVFVLNNLGLNMSDAVGMATINPAFTFGIEKKLGSIECGKNADLILVSCENHVPKVEMVFVSGCKIYENRIFSNDNAI